jgi:hypothetical protein
VVVVSFAVCAVLIIVGGEFQRTVIGLSALRFYVMESTNVNFFCLFPGVSGCPQFQIRIRNVNELL